MSMKSILSFAAACAAAFVMASDTPEVSNVVMTQAAHGRKVTITYELANVTDGAVITLDVETNRTGSATNDDADWFSIGGEAVCNAQGAVWRKVTTSDADGQGRYTIEWRPDLSWEGHKIELANGGARAVVTAWALDNTTDYMVVDISAAAQPNTQRYYPAVDFLPGGLLGKADYRTTSIVMRKIMAKDVTWTMGSTPLETKRNATREATHKVTLTNNYYIGVFPVTQAQWGLIQSSRPDPSWFNNVADRAMRPVEMVCYNEIRNVDSSTTANTAYDWPAAPNPSSFLGRLRTKTGIDFDLPGEAQWEFAARAGNGDTKWGDGSSIMNTDKDANLNKLGRYRQNGGFIQDGSSYIDPTQSCGATNATAIVGTYAPNDWGLYDMAGNLYEFCLDWDEDDITSFNGKVNIDPATPGNTLSGAAGTRRIYRGGSYYFSAGNCRPAYRGSASPAERHLIYGVRLLCSAGLR